MTPKRAVKKTPRHWLRRLNVLLRFARIDPGNLDNGALAKLLDEVFFAVEGNLDPVARKLLRGRFDLIATRPALREAYNGLNGALRGLFDAPPQLGFHMAMLELARQKVEIKVPRVGGTFDAWFGGDDFPSEVYRAFADVLKASAVQRSDFLHCSYCNGLFVPLRKPRKGTPVYCSTKCSTVIGSRNYRKRRAEMRRSRKKPK